MAVSIVFLKVSTLICELVIIYLFN